MSGYSFYARSTQVLTSSYHVDNDSAPTWIYIAKSDGEFGPYADYLMHPTIISGRSGSGRVMVPSTGEYCLVWRPDGGDYLSLYIELRATIFSTIEIMSSLLLSLFFLFFYSAYFPKIEARAVRGKTITQEMESVELAKMKETKISEEESKKLYEQLHYHYTYVSGRGKSALDDTIDYYVKKGPSRDEAVYLLARKERLLPKENQK